LVTALILFPLLGLMLTLPWLIYHYRKYGFLSWRLSLIFYSFVFYMLCAFFLVVLPVPAVRDTCALQTPGTVYYSLVPFSFVWDILRETGTVWYRPSTYVQVLAEPAFLQVMFNFLLLLPFGVYLRYFFQEKYSWRRAFSLSFALSLFYEVTQLTGLYGLYTCPYRIFDVNDLLLNSTGALLGFAIAPVILLLFPSQQSLLAKKEQMLKRAIVSPVVQLLAVAIDYLLIKASWILVAPFAANWIPEWLYTLIGFLGIFCLVPLLWKGKTPGTRTLRFQLISSGTDKTLPIHFLVRSLALYFPLFLSAVPRLSNQIQLERDSAFYLALIWAQAGLSLAVLLVWGMLGLHVAIVIANKGHHLFYFDSAAHLLPHKKDNFPISK
jgi:glycopeptide antibiotics resistance protein